MVLGRAAERARIDALLAAAREGRSGGLVLRGEAGIGKSALLADAAERAEGATVLAARGVESEAELPFAGLAELLRPVVHLLDSLPGRQAEALRGALALGPPAAGDRFAVAAATLGLLAAAAEEALPLLVLVDDAHWLDRSSLEALLFAPRRTEAEGIAFLLAARPGEPRTPSDFEELTLGGLDRESAQRLLSAAAPALAPGVAERLVEGTGGNPIALSEVTGLLSAAQLAGEEPLPEPLPAADAADRAFRRTVEALAPAARTAALVAAAAGAAPVAAVASASSTLGGDLEAAEAAGLVAVADGIVDFAHPLARAAAYASAPAADRRAAHRALADAVGGDRRAWHLAESLFGPDEEVALALEQAGAEAEGRAGYAAAAAAFERAAQASADPAAAAARLLRAGDAASRAGRPAQALRALDDAEERAA